MRSESLLKQITHQSSKCRQVYLTTWLKEIIVGAGHILRSSQKTYSQITDDSTLAK